jgi:hypothetical protein
MPSRTAWIVGVGTPAQVCDEKPREVTSYLHFSPFSAKNLRITSHKLEKKINFRWV